MKKVVGYIYCEKKAGIDEKTFSNVAKKMNIELVKFNVEKPIYEEELESKIKKCDIFFNNSAEKIAIEFVKTIESLGKKVIESSESAYYFEDKWMFYMLCKEKNIPTPETILLTNTIPLSEQELKRFNRWPVILKRIDGCMGEFVEKAENMGEARKILEKFWKGAKEREVVIAQEFIPSKSFRVTIIDGKTIQTATKDNTGWKSTGVYQKYHHKFKINLELKKIIEKTKKATKMEVFGLDLLKKNNHWLVLELNSEPSLDFFPKEEEKLVKAILNLLVRKTKKIKK